jgi:hypothetical protein
MSVFEITLVAAAAFVLFVPFRRGPRRGSPRSSDAG